MGNGKAKSVIEYLDNLVAKGKATKGAIVPLKIAFTKVLQAVDGDAWEETEVKTIDIDDYMNRFSNLTLGKYSNDSLTAYKSRLNKAVAWYLHFLEKPGWTPDLSQRAPRAKSHTKLKSEVESRNARHSIAVVSTPSDHIPSRTNFITYPFPLKSGQFAQLSLPADFSATEAMRLSAFIKSIALDSHDEGKEADEAKT